MDFSSLLPAWMPAWAALAIFLPVLLWCLAFLLVPFSVIGLKSRLDDLEAQIDSLHEDLRIMGMRMTGALPPATRSYEDVPDFNQLKRARPGFGAPEEPVLQRPGTSSRAYAPPPTPPADSAPPLVARRDEPPPRPRRAEPKFD
jgi:hypothetical protein